jgi:putative protease
MNMRKIEILAPAGSLESLYAAVQSGADAVYLGGNKFSARAYASNFDEENMIKAVDYCHLYGMKVYITINTLIKEKELKEAIEYVSFLYSIGVDALIIQDLGLASLIKTNFPDFELHASTQMTIHNGEGALFLKEQGFKRIVLSRELSLKEIEYISKDLGVETEIFVHGALCICYSGQCLMSSMIGGRSGNRGRCAQPCRLPYTLIDKNTNKKREAYILSPKDICTLEDIRAIIESGTSSLKIEGRMKRPEYVAGVVDVYKRAAESVYENREFDFEDENKKLLQLFNREGFSKAYLFGNSGRDMMAYKYPKNTGVFLGRAVASDLVELEAAVALGDGVRTKEEGFTVSKILKNGREVEDACKGDRVKLMPARYKKGEDLYKTADSRLLEELGLFYSTYYGRKIELDLHVSFKAQEPFVLKISFQGREFIVNGEIVQTALKKPVEREKLIENLSKSGDTPFRFSNIEYEHFEEGFLPVSAINAARRELVEKLEKYIIDGSRRELKDTIAYAESKPMKKHLPKAVVVASSIEHIKAFKDSGIKGVLAVDPFKRQNLLDLEDIVENYSNNLYIRVPNIIKGEFDYIVKLIDKHINVIQGIVTSNLGIINKYKDRTQIIGDYKSNIFNSEALKFYTDILQGTAISVELNKGELQQVVKGNAAAVQVKLYGKEELMVSEYCSIGSMFGGKSNTASCKENCAVGNYALIDRKDESFILRTDKFCRSYIYNSVSTNLIPHIEEFRSMGIESFRLDFIDESYEEALKILKAFKDNKWEHEYTGFTRGHYKRGVE